MSLRISSAVSTTLAGGYACLFHQLVDSGWRQMTMWQLTIWSTCRLGDNVCTCQVCEGCLPSHIGTNTVLPSSMGILLSLGTYWLLPLERICTRPGCKYLHFVHRESCSDFLNLGVSIVSKFQNCPFDQDETNKYIVPRMTLGLCGFSGTFQVHPVPWWVEASWPSVNELVFLQLGRLGLQLSLGGEAKAIWGSSES